MPSTASAGTMGQTQGGAHCEKSTGFGARDLDLYAAPWLTSCVTEMRSLNLSGPLLPLLQSTIGNRSVTAPSHALTCLGYPTTDPVSQEPNIPSSQRGN